MAKKRRSLIKTFAKAAFGLVAGVSLLYGGFVLTFYTGRGEKLTEGEAKLLKGIFGDELNVSKIRKHHKSPDDITHLMKTKAGTVLPFISHIDFFGENVASRDYSAESQYLYGFFAHEATHCWQNQNWAWTPRNFGIYEFTLKAGDRFGDFGGEQQAEIIEAYAKRFHHPDGPKNADPAQAEFDRLLQKVVEDRFPQAQITRLALEQARGGGNSPPAQSRSPRPPRL
jgi:hypothetical protein